MEKMSPIKPHSKNRSIGLPEDCEMTLKEYRDHTKKKVKSRKPKSEISKLIAEADEWFSRRVRLEGADTNGMGRCVSCGRHKEVKYMDNGHFHSRKWKATRWESKNCEIQCKHCNNSMGDPKVNESYAQHLINKYGLEEFNNLEVQSRNNWKSSRFTLRMIIEENKQIVTSLLKEKGIEKWW